jgi:hypothetical protein
MKIELEYFTRGGKKLTRVFDATITVCEFCLGEGKQVPKWLSVNDFDQGYVDEISCKFECRECHGEGKIKSPLVPEWGRSCKRFYSQWLRQQEDQHLIFRGNMYRYYDEDLGT